MKIGILYYPTATLFVLSIDDNIDDIEQFICDHYDFDSNDFYWMELKEIDMSELI
jgi:hypothetical protein